MAKTIKALDRIETTVSEVVEDDQGNPSIKNTKVVLAKHEVAELPDKKADQLISLGLAELAASGLPA